MHTGIITDLDRTDGVGLIDADDGHVVIFNRESLIETKLAHLKIGARVEFTEEESALGPRAIGVHLARASH
jgi:cold shock CspA family protein